MHQAKFVRARYAVFYLTAALGLSACGGGGGDEDAASALSLDGSELVETVIAGSVGDGPITDGRVVLQSADGQLLATQRSNDQARYRITMSISRADFPVTATVEDGTDLVTGDTPSFGLMTAVLQPGGEQIANLNPAGTLAVRVAQQMDGGLSEGNLGLAIAAVKAHFGFGLEARGIVNPITADVVKQNAASMVRSSEAAGEAIRRTLAALMSVGQLADANALIDALSADLVDGSLDGLGAAGADARVAATASIVSAQVLLETMTNRLEVGDAVATGALDSSIQQIMGGDLTVPLTGTLNITGSMLTQSRVLLDAAMLVDPNPDLAVVRDALGTAQPGQAPAQLASMLPPDASQLLDATVQQVTLATPEELATVNDAVRAAAPAVDTTINQLPSISGFPVTEVMAGDAYDFLPMAGDADGDALTFAIVNAPAWAGFDTATGRLSGTPSNIDVQTYTGIQISVSDGFGSVELPSFNINVISRPNHAPTISGAAPATVTADNLYEFTPTASDEDGDSLSFSVIGLPGWASFDAGTGHLSGVPGLANVGVYSGIQITVSDGADRASLVPFSITVSGVPNGVPQIGGSPATQVMVGSNYGFTPVASDPDGDSLNFSIAGLPSWANFDSATGQLSGTPGPGDEGIYSGIRISVSDGKDTASLPAFTVVVAGLPNGLPTISGTPSTAVTVGAAYSFTPAATDPDGDTLSFSIAGRPGWSTFDPASGHLSGTPSAGDEGIYSGIRISVSDGRDSASLPAFAITVSGLPNGAPTISGTPASAVTAGTAYSFTPTASDPDGDNLSFSVAGRPAWASFNASTGRLSGTPIASDVGTYSDIRISVSDGRTSVPLPAFSIIVDDLPNGAPTISGTPASAVTVGAAYSFTPTASDPDGDSLSFSIAGLPAWASFDPASGLLSGAPGAPDVGTYSGIRISVSDGSDSASLPVFAIEVSGLPNGVPTISGSPSNAVTVGVAYSFTPTASDPDGDALSFSIAGQPAWASFDATSGRLFGTPAAPDAGTYSGIRISVSDGKDTMSLPAFAITVNGLPNGAPTISGSPASAVTVGSAYAFTPTASDPDGDDLSFSIAGLPAWATFDSADGRLSGTPGAGDEGVYSSITISVSDGTVGASLPAFTITVSGLPNGVPTISGTPGAAVTVGSAYSFRPTASDPDGDNLSFSVAGLPAWASFNANTGRLWGTPADGNEGVYSGIGISVSDGTDSASLAVFSITVNERSNQAPSIGGSPATAVAVGSAYSFTPTASDPDGDSLSFSIIGMPAWASFDTGSGHLFGAPAAGDEGVYSGITISVSDGRDSASLPAFSITVNERPNQAPSIGGSPATAVTVGSAYSFTPTASDPDGDSLSFAIVGKPAWASFDTGNGRLSGTPGATDEGVYSGIRISVSDGTDTASLPAFALTVEGPPNQPPIISGTPAPEVTIDSEYSFTPTASDPDGDGLNFSIVGQPGWANFDSITGRLWGTPVAGDEGTYSGIRISVSDGSDTVSLADFSIAVVAQTLGSALLSWVAPTENADGTVLDDLAGFKVYYGTEIDNYPNVTDINNFVVTTHLVENLVPGTWYFVVTAYDTAGNESAYSNLASKIIP